jgi:hypothetical protein
MINDIIHIIIFYIFRFFAVALSFYTAYLIVTMILKPDIADKSCLSNSKNCSQVEIYRYNNTFIAKENISQIWFWYNGVNLFVYGQAAGSCESEGDIVFVPVSVFQMSVDKSNNINFTQLPNQCIPNYNEIINMYQQYKSNMENIFLYRKDPNELNSIFNVIKNMLNNKLFVL